MLIKLKLKEKMEQILPKLLGALGGKVEISPDVFLELFGKFDFSLSRKGDEVILTSTGIKPRITAIKHILFASAEFTGNLSSIRFNSKEAHIDLEGLPDPTIEFV